MKTVLKKCSYFLRVYRNVHAIQCSSASVISEGPSIFKPIKRAGSNRAANLTANIVPCEDSLSTDKPEEKKMSIQINTA